MSKKLNNAETAPKIYWKILNCILSNKKIPSIPPLLVNGEIISNFSKKRNFLIIFTSQCTSLSNTTNLAPITIRTDKRLSSLKVNEDDILYIIKNLNSNKSHCWDKLSFKMIKMCDRTLVYPLKLIFKASIEKVFFRTVGKKAVKTLEKNVVPIHKKESKILLKN